jgi:hypothetical protein
MNATYTTIWDFTGGFEWANSEPKVPLSTVFHYLIILLIHSSMRECEYGLERRKQFKQLMTAAFLSDFDTIGLQLKSPQTFLSIFRRYHHVREDNMSF